MLLTLFTALALPLGSPNRWQAAEFDDIPPNVVSHSGSALQLKVSNSASPLFYALGRRLEVNGVKASGETTGLPLLPPESEEGIGNADDYVLRVGLVVEGKRRIGWFERLWAPGWLKRLSDLDPDRGFDHVLFLTLAQRTPIGKKRRHPSNDRLIEQIAATVKGPGRFSFEVTFREPLPVFAVWLQSDGDDSKSSFDVTLRELSLR